MFAKIIYIDTNDNVIIDDSFALPFNWECRGWQYVSGAITIPENAVTVSSIVVGVRYANNLNAAYFDNIILTHGDVIIESSSEEEESAEYTETKDSLDRVIRVEYADGNSITEYTYVDDSDVIATETYTETDDSDTYITTYTYTDGNLSSVRTTKNNVETLYEEYEYDSLGNRISSAITTDGKTLKSSNTYENGNVSSATDSRGNTSIYSYSSGLLYSQTNAAGIATRYLYDKDRLTSQYLDEDMDGVFTSGEKRVIFEYDSFGRISTVTNGSGYYIYNYNAVGLLSNVSTPNRTLITIDYNSAYTQITGYTYGGITKTYEYDIYGNLISIKHNDVLRYSFKYNCLGLLESVYDAETGINRRYIFDTVGNEWSYRENNGNYLFEKRTTEVNDTQVLIYDIDNVEYSYYTEYDEDSGTSSYVIPGGVKITGDTDGFGREASYTVSDTDGNAIVDYDYGYETWTDDDNVHRTSEFISTLEVNGKTYTYTYDVNGNIASVSVDNVLDETYTYDAAGQLVRNDSVSQNKSITYTYDSAGNIKKIEEYDYTLGTLGSVNQTRTFNYFAAIDTMSNYNGVSIGYDASGNPSNWRD